MKLGFIGFGNMSGAILTQLLSSGFINGKDVFIYDHNIATAQEKAFKIGVNLSENVAELVRSSDYVLIGVKPQVINSVLNEIGPGLVQDDKVIISIAAGITLNDIFNSIEEFNNHQAIIRVMPNFNALVGESASAITGNKFSNTENLSTVNDMFDSLGKSWQIDEKYFSIFTAMSGSMPAFVFLFIDSVARAGVKYGIPKNIADEIAIQSVLGSSKSLSSSFESPWQLIDKVSSPGGTTIEGLLKMIEKGFISDVVATIDETVIKDKSLH